MSEGEEVARQPERLRWAAGERGAASEEMLLCWWGGGGGGGEELSSLPNPPMEDLL